MRHLSFTGLLVAVTSASLASAQTGQIYIEGKPSGTITIKGKTMALAGNGPIVFRNGAVVSQNGAGGPLVEGSGVTATEKRELDDFTKLHLSSGANVVITSGPSPSCKVTADDNIVPLIQTDCKDGTPHISAKESFSTNQPMTVAIQTPAIESVVLMGSGNVDIHGGIKETIEVKIQGSGNVIATGQVKEMNVTLSGSGSLKASTLQAERATVRVVGSGNANIHVTGSLDAKVVGSGDIRYRGSPSDVNRSVAGSGSITRN